MLKPEQEKAISDFTSSHNGKPLNTQAMLKKNTMVAKVLVARLMSMSDEQRAAIKTIITPQTSEALKVLLPELEQLIDKGSANGAG